MARYTSAYSSFISRLDEVNCLRILALEKERKDPIGLSGEINALCRGAIILLCSHLEAYIKEIGSIGLNVLYSKKVDRSKIAPQLYYHISKDLIREIKDAGTPEIISEKIFFFLDNDLEFWSRNSYFDSEIDPERFNMSFSNPGFKKINSYFFRFGYSSYIVDLESNLGGNFYIIITMVNHLVHTRNKIAHGDQDAMETPAEIKQMINLVRHFCRETDSVVGNWWMSNYCSIR